MNQQDQAVLTKIATMLDLDELLSLCQSNKKLNRLICKQDIVWISKLNNEFPDWRVHFKGKPVRQIYSLLVKLSKLKSKISYNKSIYDLFKESYLDLSDREIIEVPPEIGSLVNLEELYLQNNKIVKLPPEIGSLTNLKHLYLHNNKIVELPSEIGSLKKLEFLWIHQNQIVELPPEMSNLIEPPLIYLDKKVKNIPYNLKLFTKHV